MIRLQHCQREALEPQECKLAMLCEDCLPTVKRDRDNRKHLLIDQARFAELAAMLAPQST
jgi:hypothetical protein